MHGKQRTKPHTKPKGGGGRPGKASGPTTTQGSYITKPGVPRGGQGPGRGKKR